MREAVIVSYARTGMAKANRGSLNNTHGITMAGTAIKGALDRAGIEAGLVEDVFLGCAQPEGATGHNVARNAALWAGCPSTTSGATINRFCSSGLQAIANAAHTVINEGAPVAIGGGVESLSLVSRSGHMNLHRYTEDELMKKWPAIWMTMIETAEIVADRYGVSREYQDEYSAESQKRTAAFQEKGYMAEEILGAALTPDLRKQVEIVTKCDIVAPVGRYADARVKYYDTSRAHIMASVDHSLSLMGINEIDLLLIHRPDPLMDHRETGEALDELVGLGKVRAVGVSNFRLHDWTLLQSAMKTPLVTNQIELSLSAHQGFTNGDVAYLQERGIPPMAWSPLGGGALMTEDTHLTQLMDRVADDFLADRAAVAVAWLLAHPAGILPVMGTNSIERIKAISHAFDIQMTRELWFELYTAALGQEVP